MGNTTLKTNHYASLIVEYLQKSYERFTPLCVKNVASSDDLDAGYQDE